MQYHFSNKIIEKENYTCPKCNIKLGFYYPGTIFMWNSKRWIILSDKLVNLKPEVKRFNLGEWFIGLINKIYYKYIKRYKRVNNKENE